MTRAETRRVIVGAVLATAWSASALLPGAAAQRGASAQTGELPRCFVLTAADARFPSMLDPAQGRDTLILTDEPLDGSPGATEGRRAYFGEAAWRAKAPLQPLSTYWTAGPGDSLRVGFVLPLAGMAWVAEETAAGLEGRITFTTDEAGEPPVTSALRGVRIPCPGQGQAARRVHFAPFQDVVSP